MSADNLARYPSLVGKTVLITGGGSGIGGAMSVLFASQDCSVVVLDIDDAASRRLVDGLCNDGRRATYVQCDVTDIDALQRTIRAVESAHGAVDGTRRRLTRRSNGTTPSSQLEAGALSRPPASFHAR